jgi:protein-disulfide isomerase
MRKYYVRYVCTAIIVVLRLQNVSFAQQDIQDGMKAIERGQSKILEELQSIKTLLQSKQAAPNTPPQIDVRGVEFDLLGNPMIGVNDSKVVMIEFTDYQCQFCGRFVRDTFSEIRKQFIDTGKIRYAVMDNPLAMHNMAKKAAEASHCASAQGKFWEMHDQMMRKQESISDLSSITVGNGINLPQFEDCLNTNRYTEYVSKEMALAQKLGITGVPGFIIAEIISEDPLRVRGIRSMYGAQPFTIFQSEIENALALISKQRVSSKSGADSNVIR